MTNFQQLNLSKSLEQAINAMGFEEPTPIQARAVPVAVAGKDLIGQARTGTGKTAAFGLPMIEHMTPDRRPPQGLVVEPTRELTVQVAEELNRIGQFKGIAALPVYGGQDINRQIKNFKNRPHIIVGTPGRLLDHIRRRTLRLQDITHVVLDEADEMLNMGFIEDVEKILAQTPTQRQTMLFSATMPPPIKRLAGKFLRNPEHVQVSGKQLTVPAIRQSYVEISERQKFDTLCRLLDMHPPELALVFCRTKRRIDAVAEGLIKRGYMAGGIHGDMTQAKREAMLARFRQGNIDILVATDVAARGWDISGISHIYNFDVPQDSDSYVHRIGRTGRAGQSGHATTLVTSREINHLKQIQRLAGAKINRMRPPTPADALHNKQQLAAEKLREIAKTQSLGAYTELAEQLLQDEDSTSLLAAALKLLTKESDSAPVQISDPRPPRQKPPFKRRRRR